MGKCTACGKSGLFLKVNSFGLCNTCQASFEANKAKPKEQPIKQEPTPTPIITEEKKPIPSIIDISEDVLLSEEEFDKKIKDIDFEINLASRKSNTLKSQLDIKWNKNTFEECKKSAQDVLDLQNKKIEVIKTRMEQLKKIEQEKPAQPELKAEKNEVVNLSFEDMIDDFKLIYKYKDQNVAGTKFNDINYESLHIGDTIDFVLDPENEYDPKAIKIVHNNNLLGHVHVGLIQDMIHDWFDRDDLVLTKITNIDADNKSLKYTVAFYKDRMELLRKFECISTALVKTSKKINESENRQDNLRDIDKDDTVKLDYDIDSDSYIVTDDYNNEIGELSKVVSKKLYEKEDDFDFVCLVAACGEQDDGKYGADVEIYLEPKSIGE